MVAELLTPAWTQLRPHAIQRELWTFPGKFAIVTAGRGSGKTELAKRRLVRYLPIQKDWPTRYFYAGPTERQARRIAWDHLLALTPKEWLAGEPKLGEGYFETVFNSRLYIVGMDRPQRIEGDQWDGCVIDESCDIKPGTFAKTVVPMLTHRNGWCWRVGVPKRQGIGAKEFREAFEKGLTGDDPEMQSFTWPSSDILRPDQIQWAAEHLDAIDYREQFGGIFQLAGGGIFHAFAAEYNCRPVARRSDRAIIVGMDFNVNPMCWVIGHRYDQHIEFFAEIFVRDTNTPACLDILYQQYRDHPSGFEFYGDATGAARKTSAERSDYMHVANHAGFNRLGRTLHIPRGNPRVADRFAATNAMLRNAAGTVRLFIDPHGCPNLIADLQSRYYKPGTRESATGEDLGHMTDALGYPVHYLYPVALESAGGNAPAIAVRM